MMNLYRSQTLLQRPQRCSKSRPVARAFPGARPPPQAVQDLVAIVEEPVQQDEPASGAQGASTRSANSAGAAPAAATPKEPMYKALLAIILKLAEQQRQPQQQQSSEQQQQYSEQQRLQRLEAFLRSQPMSTSVPFISWLADLEATATGPRKAQLAWLCEALVMLRDAQDREGQEQLYQDSLALLAGGNEQVSALMAADPRQYALALAEAMTGQPLALSGFSPTVDLLLQVAPSAALTPGAVAQGHQLAAELAQDLALRRKTTLAAMLGRTRVTPEQQAQLMSGSPASRICDLLLTLASSEERVALLPDCFTAPERTEAAAAGGDDDSSSSSSSSSQLAEVGAAAAAEAEGEQETEELWCTPMQLLNEIDRRLKAAAGAAAPGTAAGSSGFALPAAPGTEQQQRQHAALPPGSSSGTAAGGMLAGAAAAAALAELKQHIESAWLASLPQHKQQQQQSAGASH